MAYLPAFWWGAPHATDPLRKQAWGVDDETPLGPLAEMHNLIEPKPDRNLGYPLMYAFVDTAAYVPYIAFLFLSEGISAVDPIYPFGLADPVTSLRTLSMIASLVSVLMASGIVVAAYLAAREFWDNRTSLLAALMTLVTFPMFYYSRTGNVDVPVLFFSSLALTVYARSIARELTTRRAIWLGLFIGLALGTKEPSAATFISLPPVLVALRWNQVGGSRRLLSWPFWKPLLATLGAAFLSFGLGSGLFVRPERYLAHIAFARDRLSDVIAGDAAFVQEFPFDMTGHLRLIQLMFSHLIDAMTLPGLAMAFVGVALAVRKRSHLGVAFSLPAFTYLAVLFLSARTSQLRYVMPAAFTLTFFSARAITAGWESKRIVTRSVTVVIAAVIVTLNLLYGLDLTYRMVFDSRFAAGEWLAEQTNPGDVVEHFGPVGKLPPLEEGVATAMAIPYYGAVYAPRTGEEVVTEIKDGWNQRRPDYIVIMPDHSSDAGVPHSASCPPEIFDGLMDGTLGYELAAEFQRPPLFARITAPDLDYPTVSPPIRVFAPLREGTG